MSVWILEWHTDGDYHATIWQTEKDANIQACSEIQDAIAAEMDLDDEEVHGIAKSILDHMACGDFASAINEWNDYQGETDRPSFYCISEKVINTSPCAIQSWVLGDFKSADDDEDEDEEDEQNKIDTLPPMQLPGATCRGPCKTYNEYAYADRMDSTYLCYQCKTFKSICSS